MSQRFTANINANGSKNTRLPVAQEFGNYRFGRDALAHVSRYLWVVETLEQRADELERPLAWLDVGCGDVYLLRTLQASSRAKKADVVAQYVGLDIDEKMLAMAKVTAPKSVPVRLVTGDITVGALDRFADASFDVVTCLEVLEHVQPKFVPGVLAGIRRVIGAAGFALISTPNWTGGSGRLPEDHIKEWDAEELLQAMKDAGLRVHRRFGTFCQLDRAKKAAAADPFLARVWGVLSSTCDANFASLAMARFLDTDAQNLVYVCSAAG